MLVCPGVEGDLGIMSNHQPLITSLRSGQIKIFIENAMVFSMNIVAEQQGLLVVNEKNVTILLETFCPIHYDANISGCELMQPFLRVNSPLYGEYKIENNALLYLDENYKDLLQHYTKSHKLSTVTHDFLRGLSGKAA